MAPSPTSDRCHIFAATDANVQRLVVEQVQGMQTEADYRALIDRRALALADPVQAAALALWGQGERGTDTQVLAEGARAEPERPGLPLPMARLRVQH